MTVRVTAASKLTLTLRVLGTQPDGFHALDALVVSVSAPADVLTLDVAPGNGDADVTCHVSGPASAHVPTDERNLAVRALQRLRPTGAAVALHLHKEIPAGAGLGGGSADAAAALVALRAAFALPLDDDALRAEAAELGSDVPFCVAGGAAWMRGRGERIEPLPVPSPFPVLIAVPPFGCSTPAVYRQWDAMGGPQGVRTVPAPAAVAHLVDGLEPRLAAFRAAVEGAAGLPAVMAGSGSAYAVCFDDPIDAARAAAAVSLAVPDGLVTVGETTAAGVLPTE
ncbi:MAG: 4-(cytidine 5'-diphospho)-2-C-methyl-D-erythritol kinase [Acidimicrobiia bacterium]